MGPTMVPCTTVVLPALLYTIPIPAFLNNCLHYSATRQVFGGFSPVRSPLAAETPHHYFVRPCGPRRPDSIVHTRSTVVLSVWQLRISLLRVVEMNVWGKSIYRTPDGPGFYLQTNICPNNKARDSHEFRRGFRPEGRLRACSAKSLPLWCGISEYEHKILMTSY